MANKRFQWWMALGMLCVLLAAVPVWAQSGFGIKPAEAGRGFFEYTLQPGETVNDAVQVSNEGAQTVAMKLYVLDAHTARNGGPVYPGGDGTNNTGAGAWVTFPAGQATLDPGVRGDVPFSVSVPKGTPPGEYMAGIVAEDTKRAGSPETQAQFQVQVVNRSVVPIRVIVPGQAQIAFAIDAVEHRIEQGVSRFYVTLKNSGNVSVKIVGGKLEVFDATGKTIGTQPLQIAGQFLARDSAVPEIAFAQPLPPGQYGVRALVDYGGDAPAVWQSAFEVTPPATAAPTPTVDAGFQLAAGVAATPAESIAAPAEPAAESAVAPVAPATPVSPAAPGSADTTTCWMYMSLGLLCVVLILLAIIIAGGVLLIGRRR